MRSSLLLLQAMLALQLWTCMPMYRSLMSLLMSRNNRRREVEEFSFDDTGRVPGIDAAYRAIEKASTIIAIKASNATVLTYRIKDTFESSLLVSSSNKFTRLFHPNLYIFSTGIAGDCRYVSDFAAKEVCDYIASYGCPPSGTYIAEKVGTLKTTISGKGAERFLATHSFVIDVAAQGDGAEEPDGAGHISMRTRGFGSGPRNSPLYEIDAGGNFVAVHAGISGAGALKLGKAMLEDGFHPNMSPEEAKVLAEKIIRDIEKEALEKSRDEDDDWSEESQMKDADAKSASIEEALSRIRLGHIVLYEKKPE
jgi:20S proteasome alpha/beta subunit